MERTGGRPREAIETLIRRETIATSPLLCPEIELHLVTEQCPLWRATERELSALDLPEPYWAFAWPGGQALARYLLDHPGRVRGRRVLDFGSGSGLVGIAAARSGAEHVLAADIDSVAIVAIALNAARNRVVIESTVEDLVGTDVDVDVVLAGDVCYEPRLAARILDWLERLARKGVEVLVGDPGRGQVGRSSLIELAAYDAPADIDTDGRIRRRTRILAMRTAPKVIHP